MRTKPTYSDISDKAWEIFNEFADLEGYGDDIADWEAWFSCWENGYDTCNELVSIGEATNA